MARRSSRWSPRWWRRWTPLGVSRLHVTGDAARRLVASDATREWRAFEPGGREVGRTRERRLDEKNLSLIRGHRPTQGTPAPLAANPTLATTGLRTAVSREIIVEGGGKGRGDQGGRERNRPRDNVHTHELNNLGQVTEHIDRASEQRLSLSPMACETGRRRQSRSQGRNRSQDRAGAKRAPDSPS